MKEISDIWFSGLRGQDLDDALEQATEGITREDWKNKSINGQCAICHSSLRYGPFFQSSRMVECSDGYCPSHYLEE